ncbi:MULTISPECIES: pentapeptide repeat-containing protein [unclassified Moorena]|uniref:pentapeptide repeat-containing protein n=1 Tax=unclassified Moorena TaxID=2683338 RepID=UPI0013BC7AA5|nr:MULTISPECIES: pentapeptide repeat-containing protein [unclassified Moorena]NEQ17848.1 pentapeptide repeat-containing protein [Moorena sp. SIO3E2]NER90773.1 pentapeptide repeat-containing protein [Moorena sp. SIO3A2]NES41125.1 pentapeptide repeat-containing protein [Moorena sp. SIO2C4]
MKAQTILARYAQGERDFRRENLRGQSFQGRDLSGADFSKADIRGANFKNTILTGTKFRQAKAGLQRSWSIVILLVSSIALILSAIVSFYGGCYAAFIVNDVQGANLIFGWIALVAIIVLFVVILGQGIQTVQGLVVGLVFAFAVAVAVAGAFGLAFPFALAFALGLPLVIALAVATTGAGSGVLDGVLVGVLGLLVAVGAAVAGVFAVQQSALTFSRTGALGFEVASAIGGTLAFLLSLLGSYLGWEALNQDPKHAWIRTIAIAFAATGGTSFYNADLTDADFTGATLKSTDLRKANLTGICLDNTSELDLARRDQT